MDKERISVSQGWEYIIENSITSYTQEIEGIINSRPPWTTYFEICSLNKKVKQQQQQQK